MEDYSKDVNIMPDLFVCHCSSDHAFVNWLARELGKKGIKAWVDEGEILVGDSLIERIQKGISKTKYFAAVLSKNSVKSRWVTKELEMAIAKEFEEGRVVILPVIIEDCEIPLYLKTKRYADFRKSDEKGLQDLLQVLVGKSDFQCMLFRQKEPALYIKGYRQKIEIKNYSDIIYKNEKVPVVVGKKIERDKCFFGINIKNLTDQTRKNIKISVKPTDSTKRILECSPNPNTQIIEGGTGLNFVSYNILLLHPYEEHHFSLATNTDQWPEIDIICESGIWDGKINKMDIIPREHSVPQ